MPALFTHAEWTACPRMLFGLRAPILERDEFFATASVMNDSDTPFPPSDMIITARWQFANGHGTTIPIKLSKGELGKGQGKTEPATGPARIAAQASGYAQLYVSYEPSDMASNIRNGGFLYDTAHRRIDADGRYSIAQFPVASITELLTLRALWLAVVAAVLSGVGVLLTVLLRR